MSQTDADCPDCRKHKQAVDSAGEPERGRILVTGAGGFVGKRLCAALADRGYKVRALVRSDRDDSFFKSLKAQIYTGDIRQPDVADWACDGAQTVFHLASIVSCAGAPDREFWDTHVTATQRLLTASKKHGVQRFVHCSTTGVLGHIANPPADESSPYNVEDIYQVTKAEGEKVAMEYHALTGLPVTVVRPAVVYGPGDRRLLKLFRLVAQRKFVMVGNGETLIHPVYVDDLVEGMILAGQDSRAVGRVYIIGGAQYISLKQWVETIAETAGVKPIGVCIPYAPVHALACVVEALCKPLGIEPPLFRRRIDFFVKNRAFSIRRAEEELGYHPAVDIRQGARLTLAWYREQGWI